MSAARSASSLRGTRQAASAKWTITSVTSRKADVKRQAPAHQCRVHLLLCASARAPHPCAREGRPWPTKAPGFRLSAFGFGRLREAEA
jgi:hypothetical protein